MSPIVRRHVAFVNNLTQLLAVRLAGRVMVSVQNLVVLADDTEPDLTVLRQRLMLPDDRRPGRRVPAMSGQRVSPRSALTG